MVNLQLTGRDLEPSFRFVAKGKEDSVEEDRQWMAFLQFATEDLEEADQQPKVDLGRARKSREIQEVRTLRVWVLPEPPSFLREGPALTLERLPLWWIRQKLSQETGDSRRAMEGALPRYAPLW